MTEKLSSRRFTSAQYVRYNNFGHNCMSSVPRVLESSSMNGHCRVKRRSLEDTPQPSSRARQYGSRSHTHGSKCSLGTRLQSAESADNVMDSCVKVGQCAQTSGISIALARFSLACRSNCCSLQRPVNWLEPLRLKSPFHPLLRVQSC